MKISKRLQTIASYVNKGDILADIGSDHAYLPCFLVEQGIIYKAYACDVVDGPVQAARDNVASYGYDDKIEVLKGDGLAPIRGKDVDVITIAGMGGALIASILSANIDIMNVANYMVLQPNNSEPQLRRFLFSNQWYIDNEVIIEEAGRSYEIIIASKIKREYRCTKEQAIAFGPILLEQKNSIFIKKWQQEASNIKLILAKINDKSNTKYLELDKKLELIESIL